MAEEFLVKNMFKRDVALIIFIVAVTFVITT
jgi:hypothetical protein